MMTVIPFISQTCISSPWMLSVVKFNHKFQLVIWSVSQLTVSSQLETRKICMFLSSSLVFTLLMPQLWHLVQTSSRLSCVCWLTWLTTRGWWTCSAPTSPPTSSSSSLHSGRATCVWWYCVEAMTTALKTYANETYVRLRPQNSYQMQEFW